MKRKPYEGVLYITVAKEDLSDQLIHPGNQSIKKTFGNIIGTREVEENENNTNSNKEPEIQVPLICNVSGL